MVGTHIRINIDRVPRLVLGDDWMWIDNNGTHVTCKCGNYSIDEGGGAFTISMRDVSGTSVAWIGFRALVMTTCGLIIRVRG